jgi:hypothetical protein
MRNAHFFASLLGACLVVMRMSFTHFLKQQPQPPLPSRQRSEACKAGRRKEGSSSRPTSRDFVPPALCTAASRRVASHSLHAVVGEIRWVANFNLKLDGSLIFRYVIQITTSNWEYLKRTMLVFHILFPSPL